MRLLDRWVFLPLMKPAAPSGERRQNAHTNGGKLAWLAIRCPMLRRRLEWWEGTPGILWRRRWAVRVLSSVLSLGLRIWFARCSRPSSRSSKS